VDIVITETRAERQGRIKSGGGFGVDVFCSTENIIRGDRGVKGEGEI
jgi:hypothetical protein